MTDLEELGRALASLAAAFDALSVTWAIGGSLASAAHGEPRATNDVDVVALLDERTAIAFAKLLGQDFYADADAASAAVRTRRRFNVIDNRSFIKINVFIPAAGPLGAGQLDRRRTLEILPDVPPLPVLGPEDIVLQKLQWFRIGGEVSERQRRDVVSVLRTTGRDLDEGYLRSVADSTGLAALLERAQRDAAQ